MKSVDDGSGGVSRALVLNSGDLINGDSDSTLVRTGVSSSASTGPVIVSS